MVNVSELIAKTSAEGAARTEERKAARANLSEMRTAVLGELTVNPELYLQFLDLMGDNMRCSPGNVALTMAQMEEPTHIGSLQYWHEQGRSVKSEEMDKGAQVFVPAKNRQRGYFMGVYYDVSQTTDRPVKAPLKLEADSPKMEMALETLMRSANVPLKEQNGLGSPAYYDPEKMEIAIDPGYSTGEVFAALTTELTLAYAHKRGYKEGFCREDYQLDAESVGYMVCRRFGVACPAPNMEALSRNYDGYEPEDRETALNSICKTARDMGDRVEKAVQPRQQEKGHKRSFAR